MQNQRKSKIFFKNVPFSESRAYRKIKQKQHLPESLTNLEIKAYKYTKIESL